MSLYFSLCISLCISLSFFLSLCVSLALSIYLSLSISLTHCLSLSLVLSRSLSLSLYRSLPLVCRSLLVPAFHSPPFLPYKKIHHTQCFIGTSLPSHLSENNQGHTCSFAKPIEFSSPVILSHAVTVTCFVSPHRVSREITSSCSPWNITSLSVWVNASKHNDVFFFLARFLRDRSWREIWAGCWELMP